MRLDEASALAWRLRRHGLGESPDASGAVDVARRVLAVRGWPKRTADFATGTRLAAPDLTGVDRGLASGELVRSYAFRGGSYVLTPDMAADVLTVRTATRVWETRRYQDQGAFTIDDWRPFREAIAGLLAAGPLTRTAISRGLENIAGLAHLAPAALGTGSDSLYKPLHWWGDICFGPSSDGEATFRLLHGPHGFAGVSLDEAGPRVVADYLRSYGPATEANLEYWLTEGLSVPRRLVAAWIAQLGDAVVEVQVDGRRCLVHGADREDVAATEPFDVVRLLPGYDPWVMGPGTADERIVPAAQRGAATRGADLVVRNGVVSGTWRVRAHTVEVMWLRDAGAAPRAAVEAEVERVSGLLGKGFTLALPA
jgi:hypothetical protein